MKKLIICLSLILYTTTAFAHKPIPDHQATDENLLWLSRALVSEVGFKGERGHAIISWILARKWRNRYKQNTDWTFKKQIKSYCTEFKAQAINPERKRWVSHLPADGVTKPKGWPKQHRWSNFKKYWIRIQNFVKDWSEGLIPDPCGGKATDWAARFYKPNLDYFKKVNCGNTKNVYYRYRG